MSDTPLTEELLEQALGNWERTGRVPATGGEVLARTSLGEVIKLKNVWVWALKEEK